jgi:hypothetical protein
MATKITEKEYQLHTIEALDSNGLMDGGTTMPLSIRGVNTTNGERGQYILKWRNANRLSTQSMTNELLGAWIATELGISCVTPVLINISEDFVNKSMVGQEGFKAASQCIGINFGSEYIPGLLPFVNQFKAVDERQINQAIMIFLFDLFVDNSDRGQGKPNLFYQDGRYVVLDHEMIFSFLEILLGQNVSPWIIKDDRELYYKHPLLPYLKNVVPDVSSCVEQLTKIDNRFWDAASKWLPKECNLENISKIKSRLDGIISNRDIFAEQISLIIQS